jgi:hypothetical protein
LPRACAWRGWITMLLAKNSPNETSRIDTS